MTVNTMSAMVIAGLNSSNKRLLVSKMVDGIPSYSSIYIYSYGGLNGFQGRMGWMPGDWKTEMLFRNGKWVLPGTGDLKHESAISVDIMSRVAELREVFRSVYCQGKHRRRR